MDLGKEGEFQPTATLSQVRETTKNLMDYVDFGALVASTLPSELDIDPAALRTCHAPAGGGAAPKCTADLFDARWRRGGRAGSSSHRKPRSLANQRTCCPAAQARLAKSARFNQRPHHPAAQARLAKDVRWQLALAPQPVVVSYQVVWPVKMPKLYVTHYILA